VWALTIAWTIDSPSPEPSGWPVRSVARRSNGWVSRSTAPASMTGPVLAIDRTATSPRRSVITSIRPGFELYASALSARFATRRSTRRGSPVTGAGSRTERSASEISGSLGTTARLAKDLGRWLAIAVLAAAFAVAALLMVAAVSRRVREFGTLKALGWPARRITAQVLGESVTIGAAGALAGIGLGYAATALISTLESTLTATAAAAPGSTEPHGFFAGANARTGQVFHQTTLFPGTYSSTPVHFSAPVAPSVVALAAGLGIAGGLLAGALASWRAARLRPTAALAHAG
jgi:FtsX-like permease family